MKKSYLMIAAAAGLMLAACSQEDDFVAQNAAAEQGDGAVLFDTYLSNNSTRAGQPGVMTTTTLQKTGFGIFANTHLVTNTSVPFTGYGTLADANKKPDFMWNQYVSYEASNWVYSPLKYWPNETQEATNPAGTDKGAGNTATAGETEGVSFFAYAPYVNSGTDGTLVDDPATSGISALTGYDAESDPKVSYIVATGKNSATNDQLQPSKSVDLLWGVSSGFSYHPVDRTAAVIQTAGLPVTDMLKPAIDEKIKFDFKHALARIGITVVGAFDQQAAGGTKDDGTRVTIKSITVTSQHTDNVFATGGDLNLYNIVANQANWENFTYSPGGTGTEKLASIVIDNGEFSEMNPNLKAPTGETFPTVAGVLPTEQNVIVPSAKEVDSWKTVTVAANTVYNPSDGYFKAINTPILEANLVYKDVAGTGNDFLVVSGNSYKIVDTKPDVDLTTKVYEIADGTTFTAIAAGTRPAYNAATTYFVKNNSVYNEVPYNQIPLDVVADTYFTMTTATLTTAFTKPLDATYGLSEQTLYTYTTPGYFMVIPAQAKGDRNVTVTIDYLVTTKDANLEGGISKVQNVISQVVTLKDFTNGKAYNLKLILGLTSVKVDAEVSDWEVGTVESNLPKNRD